MAHDALQAGGIRAEDHDSYCILAGRADAGLILLCDHAGNAMPPGYGSLGLPPEDIVASLRSVPQIAHRLEVKRQTNGTVVIDDAYNSNPVGFASALELLDVLRQPDGRRIVVTPGMVELGAEHEAEHARIGRLAAEYADILVAVAPHRVAPLEAAFREAAPEREGSAGT